MDDFKVCDSPRECRERFNEYNKDGMETQVTISDWATRTFGYPKSLKVSIDRMLDEVEELKKLDYKSSEANFDKVADECADIYITMCQVMNVMGYNLHACVNHKMQINRARKWKLKGDGTGQHIKE